MNSDFVSDNTERRARLNKRLAELYDTFVAMTAEQRRLSKMIAELPTAKVDVVNAQWLVDHGLVDRDGDRYRATPTGAYVAALY